MNYAENTVYLPRHHAADPPIRPCRTAHLRAYLAEATCSDYQKTTFDERYNTDAVIGKDI